MANPSLQSPTYPHFFQPLLPGFDAHLKIPVTYFSKHMQEKNEHTTAKLRSEASDKTWQVKMDGRRLTEGWKDFVTAHDLRIGDIVIFKHLGDMVFNVTPFGPSFCEIQYANSHIKEEEHIDDDDDDNNENQLNIRNVLRKKNLKSKRAAESSLSYDYCFVANVTASNLQYDTIYIPKEAASSKALNKRFREIKVVNKEGNSWTLNLRFKESEGSYYIRGGWRRFCRENRQKEGDSIVFNLVGDGKSTPMICICSEEDCFELMNREGKKRKTEKRRQWVASPSSTQNRLVTIILTDYNIKASKLILPVEFTKTNGIKEKHEQIILVDKNGGKRITRLVYDGPNNGRRGLGKGWKIFFKANGVLKIGEPFVLELIWENKFPVLRFFSNVKMEPIHL